MVQITRSSSKNGQFGCIFGNGDVLKSPSSRGGSQPLSPPSFVDEAQSPRRQKSWQHRAAFGAVSKQSAGIVTWILRIAILGASFLLYKTYSELLMRKTELLVLQTEFNDLTETLIDTESELASSHEHFVDMKRELNKLQLLQSEGATDESLKGIEDISNLTDDQRSKISGSIVSRQEALTNRVLDLQKVIKLIHTKQAIQKFGEGPHYYVEFAVEIEGRTSFFLVETAPISLMPHAVYTFLLAIDEGVWNDTIFLHRNSHIVQSAPVDAKGQDKHNKLTVEHHLAFPEYAPEYDQHAKYTLGFSGRPGGPEFYINTNDNGEYHGPGGQAHHAIAEEADPCFAKVTRGFDVIEKLENLNLKALSGGRSRGDTTLFTTIKSAKIVNPRGITQKK